MPGLRFRVQASGEVVSFRPRYALVVGYAGRDQEQVRRHVEELAAAGIPAPVRVPALYRISPDRLTQSQRLSVTGAQSCGEAEAVLVLHAGQVYVGVGSDHTDRALEQRDILMAKETCPKPVGPELWRLEEILDRWDGLELRSWVGSGSDDRLYQQGTLAHLLRTEDVLRFIRGELEHEPEDALIFCGTLPLLDGTFSAEPGFSAELRDPGLNRALRCTYRTRTEPLASGPQA
jgi:hypothetical protein